MGGNDRGRIFALGLALALFVAAGSAVPPTREIPPLPSADSLAQRIARRYGADHFHLVNSLHYVFHVRYGGKDMARDWTWFPKSDSVVYKGKDAGGMEISAAYSRRNSYSMGAESVVAVDKMFVNDQYWLLFPLHLRWDIGKHMTVVSMTDPKEAARGEMYKLTVVYPPQGGYTPGDAYDLFVDNTATIQRWIFRKGNGEKTNRETLWSWPAPVGGLAISMERDTPKWVADSTAKGFRLWFTDVTVVPSTVP